MENLVVEILDFKPKKCKGVLQDGSICGKRIHRSKSGLCHKCVSALAREKAWDTCRQVKRYCWKCGKRLISWRGNGAPPTGLCHHCSCVANGHKRAGKKGCNQYGHDGHDRGKLSV